MGDGEVGVEWKHRPGDPPDTVRRWNGESWEGEPIAAPAVDSNRRVKTSATLALDFVGKPRIVETSGGLEVQVKVLNKGPIDALFSFEVRLKGGSGVEVLNPQAVISADGPVTVKLSVPLDSGITRNTKLVVEASDQAGRTIAVSATSGGVVTASVGKAMLAGLLGIGAVAGVQLFDDDNGDEVTIEADDAEEVEEVEDEPLDENSGEAEEEVDDEETIPPIVELSPAAQLSGDHTMPMVAASTDRFTTDDLAMGIGLQLLDDDTCEDCRYQVWYGGEAIGEVVLGAKLGHTDFSAVLSAGPLIANCTRDDGAQAGRYEQAGVSEARVRASFEGETLFLQAVVEQTFELVDGDPGDGCQSPWTITASYGTGGFSDFEIEKELPPVEPVEYFDMLAVPVVECEQGGQDCDQELVFEVVIDGGASRGALTITTPASHCSSMRFTVLVGGEEIGTTASLDRAESETLDLLALGAELDGDRPTEVVLRATGIEGGCNNGSIVSWAASVALDGLLATTEQPSVRPVSG